MVSLSCIFVETVEEISVSGLSSAMKKIIEFHSLSLRRSSTTIMVIISINVVVDTLLGDIIFVCACIVKFIDRATCTG